MNNKVIEFPSEERESLVNISRWNDYVSRNKEGMIYPNVANAAAILGIDSRWKEIFAYNEFERRVFILRATPGTPPGEWQGPHPLTNIDITRTQQWLQSAGSIFHINTETVHGAITLVAAANTFHPVKDWLNSLPAWDEVPRAETWLADIFGCEQSVYSAQVGKMFLLGMLRRVLTPGVKMDYMLVLEGEQGLQKSKVSQALTNGLGVGVAQFKNLTSVDTSIFIKNKWLVEFGELHVLRKSDINELKLWLVKEVEDYRPKYGRENNVEPRQCVFLGTSNTADWLNDTTGGRRFWPIKAIKVDIEKLEAIRDQLFAETMVYDARGDKHYPDREDEALHFAPEQRKRMATDPWEEELFPQIDRLASIAARSVYTRLGLAKGKVSPLDSRRVQNIFEKRGWKRDHKKDGNHFINPNPPKKPSY